MNIIIPMAGRGSRLRPHTLTTPKPLLPIAGKPIVQRLVEDMAATYGGKIDEIAYVIGDFGKQVEEDLLAVAARLGARGRIFYQDQPLGTAHAIQCAQECLEGEVIIGFADTLFRADFQLDKTKDGVIWVKEVEDPRAFGVVTVDAAGIIQELVEKPETFVSNLAIIGIYYIQDGALLRREIQHLLDNDIRNKGEYQLTDALERMKSSGKRFVPGTVKEWMDCGNKDNVLDTNTRILQLQTNPESLISPNAHIKDSIIIPPCYIGEGARVEGSVIGPHVALGAGTQVRQSVIADSIVRDNTQVEHANLHRALVGTHAQVLLKPQDINLGDFSVI
ncbi:MAG: NTP transferase domain-containing protein [Bacteroidetes bacterium]|nr:NTP transferase domain-containing protein [Bacteroidota bacterium]